jgi:hypothetical protein
MFNAATAPLRFHDFLDRMRHPQAADIVRSIKTFIVDFTSRVPDPDHDSESVQTFLSTTEGFGKVSNDKAICSGFCPCSSRS